MASSSQATTPAHSRNNSLVDYSPTHARQTSRSSRLSISSIQSHDTAHAEHSSITPLRNSFGSHDPLDSAYGSHGGLGSSMGMMSLGSSIGPGGEAGRGAMGEDMSQSGGGLGNLADELADAYSDFDEDDEDNDGDRTADYADHSQPSDYFGNIDHDQQEYSDTPGVPNVRLDIPSSPHRKSPVDAIQNNRGDDGGTKDIGGAASAMLNPHVYAQRKINNDYDGSDYGSGSDLESPGILMPSLVAKIDAVESLARRGTESNGGPHDGVFLRVAEALRDLGSQSGVEGSATRLITAHSAITTHLAHQTRQLHNLTFPLLSPLAPAPASETIDDLLPLFVSLSAAVPRPTTPAHSSLAALHTATADLVQTLGYLSDSLHMSRQATTAAARRLRAARDLVAELRREEELRDEGERWLRSGDWGERLKRRECADVCGDVVGGFEELCEDWRARLLDQVAVQEAGA